MSMIFKMEPLQRWHFDYLELQPQQKYLEDYCKSHPDYLDKVVACGGTAGVLYGEGDPICVGMAGFVEQEEGVATGWAIISTKFPKYALRATRAIRSAIDEAIQTKYHRIQMEADVTFPEACRWAEMLGFNYESTKHQGNSLRHDVAVYAITRRKDG